MTQLTEDVENKVRAAWPTASVVDCVDVTGGHACDAGAKLTLVVVSADFAGVPLVQRHRMVTDCLADDMPSRIHALSLKTWTPAQYEAKQQPPPPPPRSPPNA